MEILRNKEDPMAEVFEIKMATPAMAEEISQVDVAAWGEEAALTPEMVAECITAYPPGNFVAIERGSGRIIGTVFTVATDDHPVETWLVSSGNGTYKGIVNPFGEVIFGANLSVLPEKRGTMQVGRALLHRVMEMAWILGKRCGRLGARMPEYHRWQKVFTPEDYIRLYEAGDLVYFAENGNGFRSAEKQQLEQKRLDGERADPSAWEINPHGPLLRELRPFDGEVAFFCSVYAKERSFDIVKLLPNYFPPDTESLGYGVLLEWKNPDFD